MESSAIFRFDAVNGVLSQVSLKNYFSGLFNTKLTCSMLNLLDHILKQGNVFLSLVLMKLQNKIKKIKSAQSNKCYQKS